MRSYYRDSKSINLLESPRLRERIKFKYLNLTCKTIDISWGWSCPSAPSGRKPGWRSDCQSTCTGRSRSLLYLRRQHTFLSRGSGDRVRKCTSRTTDSGLCPVISLSCKACRISHQVSSPLRAIRCATLFQDKRIPHLGTTTRKEYCLAMWEETKTPRGSCTFRWEWTQTNTHWITRFQRIQDLS